MTVINQWDRFCGEHKLVTDSTPITTEMGPKADFAPDLATLPWDALAQQYGHAFKEGDITQERFCSILELRAISQIPAKFSILPLELLKNPDYQMIMNHFFSGNHLMRTPLERLQNLQNAIDDPNERFLTKIEINSRHWDPRIYNLLSTCHEQNIIYLVNHSNLNQDRHQALNETDTMLIYLPSVTARMHLVKMIFENVGYTSLVGRAGKLTINDIEEGVRQNNRYASVSYPGVPDPQAFHGMKAPVFFLTLHDELHRRAMSAIPPNMLVNYLHAVDVVRTATGIHWSADLWNFIDLEINIRALTVDNPPDRNPLYHQTQIFQTMLMAKRFSDEGLRGLFVASSFATADDMTMLDTTVIILIDLIENEIGWRERGVFLRHFSDFLSELLDQTNTCLKKLEQSLPMATKVAIIKHCIIHEVTGDITFVLNQYKQNIAFSKIDNYIQVLENGNLICSEAKSTVILKGAITSLISGLKQERDKKGRCSLFEEVSSKMRCVIYSGWFVDILYENPNPSLEALQRTRAIVDTMFSLAKDPCNEKARKWLAECIETEVVLKEELEQLQDALALFPHYSGVDDKMSAVKYSKSTVVLFKHSPDNQARQNIDRPMATREASFDI